MPLALTRPLQVLHQFYKMIEDSRTTGVSQGEIFHMNIGMSRKALLRRLNVLARRYGVVRVADVTDIGASQRRTMTYVPCVFLCVWRVCAVASD